VIDFEVSPHFLEAARGGPIMRMIGPGSIGRVRVELPSGEQLDVPAEELESLPLLVRAEPDGTLANWLLQELWKYDWYESFERVFADKFPALAQVYHPWQRSGTEETATWTEVGRAAGVSDRHALDRLRGDSFTAVPGFYGPDEGSPIGCRCAH
jgi:hypothetical protein